MIEEIEKAIALLDNIDVYINELPELKSSNDLAISDLYHYIKNNTMNSKSCYRIVKELKEKLIERRKIKNEEEILRTYANQKNKLSGIDNRKMILAEIHKTQKRLNQPYKNRIYNEEELKEKLEG